MTVSNASCCCCGKARREDLQRHGEDDAGTDCQRDAQPHEAKCVRPATLGEEGGDDADDERCLEALRAGRLRTWEAPRGASC